MRIVIGVIIFCLFLPYSTSRADMAPASAISNIQLHTGPTQKQDPQTAPAPDFIELSYGFVNTKLYSVPVPEARIDRSLKALTGTAAPPASASEAAVLPDEFMIKGFEKILNAISDAGELDELNAVLLDKNLEFLKAKVRNGISQYVVLAMLRGLRPQAIRILDSRFEEGRAEFVATGHSALGPIQGLIHMVTVEGSWKVEDESWQVGQYPDQRDRLIAMVFRSISGMGPYIAPGQKGAHPKSSLSDVVRKEARGKMNHNRRKRAFMFVFPMNDQKNSPDRPVAAQDKSRGRLHGIRSVKMSPDLDGADILIVKDEDRYASGEWNVVLPSGKPREVTMSWLWSF